MDNNFNEVKKIATRESFGQVLGDYLGYRYGEIVVLDADLSSATKTSKFAKNFPERHINCGIAEANMTGIAAGLSLTGIIPIITSFAMFVTGRNFEQIRNSICYPHLNVKIVGTHAGITVGEDGATHQCNEDIALMRTLPGMTIIQPCDDIETKLAIEAAIKYYGPVYIRLGRSPVKQINNIEKYNFILGKGIRLHQGNDISIVTSGIGVSIALELVEKMKDLGIELDVINIHTIKPIDEDLIIHSAKKTRKVVTIEEHSVIGGLGDAVADIISRNNIAKLLKIGIDDCFGTSAPAEELLHKYGLTAGRILERIKATFYY